MIIDYKLVVETSALLFSGLGPSRRGDDEDGRNSIAIRMRLKERWNWSFKNMEPQPQLKNSPKPKQMNPNWALLQQVLLLPSIPPLPLSRSIAYFHLLILQKLKSHASKHPRFSNVPKFDTSNSVLGKRKERSDVDSIRSDKNLLIPVNDDFRYFLRIKYRSWCLLVLGVNLRETEGFLIVNRQLLALVTIISSKFIFFCRWYLM